MSTLYHLIRVRDGAYWRPNAEGYTDKVSEAGTFDAFYAKLAVEDAHGDVKMVEANHTLFTPYEQAILHLASFDVRYHDVCIAAQRVLDSRRVIGKSGIQEAVLSEALDKLAEVAAQPAPKWGEIKS